MARSSSSFRGDVMDGNAFSTQGNQPRGTGESTPRGWGFHPVVEAEHTRGRQRLPSELLSTSDSDSSSWIAHHQRARSPSERQELATVALQETDG